jgi:hypothetical protein
MAKTPIKIPIKYYEEIKTQDVYLSSNQYIEWVDVGGINTPYKVTVINEENSNGK